MDVRKAKTPRKRKQLLSALLVPNPLSIAVNNTLAKGIYKGVVIGFTGVIAINVGNSTGTITAALLIDGLTANLTLTTMPVAKSTYSNLFKYL